LAAGWQQSPCISEGSARARHRKGLSLAMSVATALFKHSHRPIWHLIDAKGQIVGRLAAQIAPILVGKHKPTFVPSVACGDNVVVVNARDVMFTGKKLTDKVRIYITY
jgi:ribosomal protein L13